jgi:hypothetical protein
MLYGIARSQFSSSNLVEDLREFESIYKTVLAHESGDPGVQFNDKNEGRKSRDTAPLNATWMRAQNRALVTVLLYSVQYISKCQF